jgi:hypothetical protein
MTTTTEATEAKPAKKPVIDLSKEDITLDRSRTYSEIHGEHVLGFFQDRLPFDKGGRLHVEALDLPEHEAAKAALLKRLDRLKKEEEDAIRNPSTDTNNLAPIAEQIETDPDAHINLLDWAKGKIKLQPHRVYLIAQRRLGKRFQTLPEVTAEMVKRKMLLDTDVRI